MRFFFPSQFACYALLRLRNWHFWKDWLNYYEAISYIPSGLFILDLFNLLKRFLSSFVISISNLMASFFFKSSWWGKCCFSHSCSLRIFWYFWSCLRSITQAIFCCSVKVFLARPYHRFSFDYELRKLAFHLPLSALVVILMNDLLCHSVCPAHFIHFMNRVFYEYLDDSIFVFVDFGWN